MTGQSASETLIEVFTREGYLRVEPSVLQPADIFVELSGEDIRRRMFVTQDAEGAELCLRPEYTIPVCLLHLHGGFENPGSYAYAGPVFRLRTGESGEFLQAGVESIGRCDRTAADAEILSLALQGLEHLGQRNMRVRLGDMGILNALIDALGVSAPTKRRVIRSIVSGRGLVGLGGAESGGPEHPGLLAAIEGQPPEAAKALIEDVLSIAGIAHVGGRSASEIADRFLARTVDRSVLADEARRILDLYLGISADPDTAAARIRALARDAGVEIDAALSTFEERTGFLAAHGINVANLSFAAAFARNLDYYTGFIFEIHDVTRSHERPIVGGGRYDSLLQHLGASAPVPAVGCSFWLDRITQGASVDNGR
ncbi:ATP phosphoribosyltransferase regulatory subunit [Microvirga massiliensis]|uniref:ATP phosphoribosyltransferase regulatory subunit n=1 Tax=Microvirga massiliensis TaxID=1033741 RepID=UPI00062B95F3|nr:ATP phosphoribosyltransferase regulatory subunit [Microvirga massiliensis]